MPIGWLTLPTAMVPSGVRGFSQLAYPTWCMCTPHRLHPISPMQASSTFRDAHVANIPHGLAGLGGGIIILNSGLSFVCLLAPACFVRTFVCLLRLLLPLLVGCALGFVCMCTLCFAFAAAAASVCPPLLCCVLPSCVSVWLCGRYGTVLWGGSQHCAFSTAWCVCTCMMNLHFCD